MQFERLPIEGAYVVKPDPVNDARGFFARVFCAQEFADRGLVDRFVQHSIAFNARRGTVRGFHFQAPPFTETKLVRCVAGALFDVIVDLRPASPTFRRWCSVELSAASRLAAYVPAGCAHGYQARVDNCEIEYLITPEYVAEAARGVRWDDPALGVPWPISAGVIVSERDGQLPLLAQWEAGL
jgi:dTDP-4-dehydrorhamnose 3,5-epimerase